MKGFYQKEEEYINWLNSNPDGYVLNYFGGYNSEINKLHLSNCYYLRRPSDEGKRTVRYKKVCSTNLE